MGIFSGISVINFSKFVKISDIHGGSRMAYPSFFTHTVKNGVFQNTMLSGLLKKNSRVGFNNQESIVPQGCFGAPHF